MTGPLSPYRVLDLSDELGLLCGKVMGDMGADVIKVERPGGDPTRNIGPFYGPSPDPEKSLSWLALNTSKRGITLNLEKEEGQALFRQLVALADVVIESFPPGYLEGLGLDYAALCQVNPTLILTSVSPFGRGGPHGDWKGSDMVIMSMAGQMFTSGDEDRPPVRISLPQAHLQAGLHAAAGTMLALYNRRRTGLGQHADVSAQEGVMRLLVFEPLHWAFERVMVTRKGQRTYRAGYYHRVLWPCQDGMVAFRLVGGHFSRNIKPLVEWMAQEGMSEGIERLNWDSLDLYSLNNIPEIEETFGRFFLRHTKEELAREAVSRRIMLAPINSPKEVMEDPQLKAREFWTEVEHPELGGRFVYPGAPFKMGLTPWQVRGRAPRIGEHNQEVYGQLLGLSPSQIAMLKERNVL